MSTVLRLYANASAEIRSDSVNQNYSTATTVALGNGVSSLLVAFEAMADAHKYHRIDSAKLSAYATSGNTVFLSLNYLKAGFTESTVTYNTRPQDSGWYYQNGNEAPYLPGWQIFNNVGDVEKILRYGARIGGSVPCTIYTSRSGNKPYVDVTIDESDTITAKIAGAQPASGYVPRASANTFKWAVTKTGTCYGVYTQASAVFAWRAAGGGTEHTTSLTTAQSVTVAANTFPAGGIEWQVRVTDNTGATTSTAWMALDTDEPLGTATPTEPVNVIVDGTSPAALRWNYAISTGTAQSAADLQISADGSSWSALGTVSGPDTSYTAAAGALGSGTRYWRVRAYNSEGSVGAWSDAAQIVVVAGPDTPSVNAGAVPLPLVTWQADEQVAGELAVDGEKIAGAWGGDKSWQIAEPLPDGTHLIAVRVQNMYGFWSDWSEISVTVANSAGGAIALSGTAAGAAEYLSWTATGYAVFRILRDGAVVGETDELSYLDEHAPAGAHEYQILGILSTGNYGLSNTVAASVAISGVMLQDVATGAWLELPTAKSGQTAISARETLDVAAVHYSGRGLPTAEIGESAGRLLTLRPAFTRADAGKLSQLRALLRRQLFYKDPQGRAFPAVIYSMTSENDGGRISCSLTILETDGGEADA